MKPIFALLGALVLSFCATAPARAQLLVYDAGVAGSPPVAPDPQTQGWTLSDGGGVGLIPISPDPGTGLNAWEVSDSSSGYAYYFAYPLTSNAFRAFVAGAWELTATMRMTAGPSRAIHLEVSTGPTFIDTQYRIWFRIVGIDVIVDNPITGETYTCPGGAVGYHTFSIRKTNPVQYADAELLYDGVALGPLREVFPQFTSDYGVFFGSSPLGGMGRARFHRVELRALDDLGASYCGPAAANSSGVPGTLAAWGSPYVNQNLLELTAADLPAGQFGYFLAGRSQGMAMPPGSSGVICLSGNIARFNQNIIQGPSGTVPIDLTAVPVNPTAAVQPGETWNFQCWYRDVPSTSNFTEGRTILFR